MPKYFLVEFPASDSAVTLTDEAIDDFINELVKNNLDSISPNIVFRGFIRQPLQLHFVVLDDGFSVQDLAQALKLNDVAITVNRAGELTAVNCEAPVQAIRNVTRRFANQQAHLMACYNAFNRRYQNVIRVLAELGACSTTSPDDGPTQWRNFQDFEFRELEFIQTQLKRLLDQGEPSSHPDFVESVQDYTPRFLTVEHLISLETQARVRFDFNLAYPFQINLDRQHYVLMKHVSQLVSNVLSAECVVKGFDPERPSLLCLYVRLQDDGSTDFAEKVRIAIYEHGLSRLASLRMMAFYNQELPLYARDQDLYLSQFLNGFFITFARGRKENYPLMKRQLFLQFGRFADVLTATDDYSSQEYHRRFITSRLISLRSVMRSRRMPAAQEQLLWFAFICFAAASLPVESRDSLVDEVFLRELLAVKAEINWLHSVQVVCGLFYFDHYGASAVNIKHIPRLIKLFSIANSITDFPKKNLGHDIFISLMQHAAQHNVSAYRKYFVEQAVTLLEKLDASQPQVFCHACELLSHACAMKDPALIERLVIKIEGVSDQSLIELREDEQVQHVEKILYELFASHSPDRALAVLNIFLPVTLRVLARVSGETHLKSYLVRITSLRTNFQVVPNTLYFDLEFALVQHAIEQVEINTAISDFERLVNLVMQFTLDNVDQIEGELNHYVKILQQMQRRLLEKAKEMRASKLSAEKLSTSNQIIDYLRIIDQEGSRSLRAVVWLMSGITRASGRLPFFEKVLHENGIPLMALLTRMPSALINAHEAGASLLLRQFPTFGNLALCTIFFAKPDASPVGLADLLNYFASNYEKFNDKTTLGHIAAIKGEKHWGDATAVDDHGATPKFYHTCFHTSVATIDGENSEEFLLQYLASANARNGNYILHRCVYYYFQRNYLRAGDGLLRAITQFCEPHVTQSAEHWVLGLVASIDIEFKRIITIDHNEIRVFRELCIEMSEVFDRFCEMRPYNNNLLAKTSSVIAEPNLPATLQSLFAVVFSAEIAKRSRPRKQRDLQLLLSIQIRRALRSGATPAEVSQITADIDTRVNELYENYESSEMLHSTSRSLYSALHYMSTVADQIEHRHRMPVARQRLINLYEDFLYESVTSHIEAMLAFVEADHEFHADPQSIRDQIDYITQLMKQADPDEQKNLMDVRCKIQEIEKELQANTAKTPAATKSKKKSAHVATIKNTVAATAREMNEKDVEQIKALLTEFVFANAQLIIADKKQNVIRVKGANQLTNLQSIQTHLARLGIKMTVNEVDISLQLLAHKVSYDRDHWESHFPQPKKKSAAKAVKIDSKAAVATSTAKAAPVEESPLLDPYDALSCIDLLRTSIATLLGCDTCKVGKDWIIDEPFSAGDRREKSRLRFTVKNTDNGINVFEKNRLDPNDVLTALIKSFEDCQKSINVLKDQKTNREFYLIDRECLIAVIKNIKDNEEVVAAFRKHFASLGNNVAQHTSRYTPSFHKRTTAVAQATSAAPKSIATFAQWKRIFSPRNNQNIFDSGIAMHLDRARSALRNLTNAKQRSTRLYVFHIFCAIDLLNEREKNSAAANDLNLDALRQTLRHHIEQMNFEKIVANTRDLFSALADINMASQNIKADFNEDSIEDNIAFLQQLPQRLDQKHTLDQQRGVTEFEHLKELLSHVLDENDVYDAALSCCVIKEAKLSLDNLSHDLIRNVSGIVGHTATSVVATESNAYPLEATLRHALDALQSVQQTRYAMTATNAM